MAAHRIGLVLAALRRCWSLLACRMRAPRPWVPSHQAFTGSFREDEGLVLVHFWAAWNGVDRHMDRRLRSIARAFRGRLLVRSCDTDVKAHWDLVRSYEVAALPTVAALINGELTDKLVGLRSRRELRKYVRLWLAKAGE